MRKRLTREQILTIPNGMSLFRLVLIPFIIRLYWNGRNDIAVSLVILSALTDVFDGVVARKLNMVSDLGKVLDPVADKLTQGALLLCLIAAHKMILILLILLVVKEGVTLTLGSVVFKRHDAVHGAQWHGKVCTVVFESMMILLMVFPDLPENVVGVMLSVCGAVMLMSLTLYTLFYIRCLKRKPDDEA